MAGFDVRWASEFIPAAAEVYRLNHSHTTLDTRDIRLVRVSEILRALCLKEGELDLLDGSPPCASFSTSGKREKGWGQVKAYSDTKQRTDDLFFQFSRLVRGLMPKTFVAENVSGLIKGKAKGYFLEILRELRACGYNVEARLLDAQWLGVPQERQRVIFIGVRHDLGLAPVFPKPLPYRYTVRDALPWITKLKLGGEPDNWVEADRPAGTVVQSDGARLSSTAYMSSYMCEAEADIARYAIGAEWARLAVGEQSSKYMNLVRVDPERPCNTITQMGARAGAASVTHPFEQRKFYIAELKRICGFPDDFQLTGDYPKQWERLGRAVPPVMMSHVAAAVRDGVLAKIGGQ
jgi:DNA (cytosine-5)-methyltransferase 1